MIARMPIAVAWSEGRGVFGGGGDGEALGRSLVGVVRAHVAGAGAEMYTELCG